MIDFEFFIVVFECVWFDECIGWVVYVVLVVEVV